MQQSSLKRTLAAAALSAGAIIMVATAVMAATTIGTDITTDGVLSTTGNATLGSDAADLLTLNGTVQGATPLVFEGTTADAFETTFAIADPTADATITIPNTTGTLALTGNNLAVFSATTSAQLAGVLSDETGTGLAVYATSPTLVTPSLGVATATSLNGLTVTSSTGTLTVANGSTLATSGAFSITLTATGATNVTLPTTGTLLTSASTIAGLSATTSAQLAGVLSDETGTGLAVFNANAVMRNQVIVDTGTGTDDRIVLTVTGGGAASFDGFLTNASLTASRSWTFPDLTGTVALTANNLSGFAATTSAQLAGVISDETGSGALVLATNPTLSGATISTSALTLSGLDPDVTTGTNEDLALSPNGTGRIKFNKPVRHLAQAGVANDSGNASPGDFGTVNPATSYLELTCNDADGCTIALDEAAPVAQGQELIIVGATANASTLTDVAGVTELSTASIVLGQFDTITLVYASDRWVETARSNN